jgi:hypothetical protein
MMREAAMVLEFEDVPPGPVFRFESEYYQKRKKAIDFVRTGELHLELTGKAWSEGDPGVTQEHQGHLLTALVSNKKIQSVQVGSDFFFNLTEQQQQTRVFQTIGSLPALSRLAVKGSAANPDLIDTPVLLEALSKTRNNLEALTVWNILLRNESELERLVETLRPPRGGSLARLSLKLIIAVPVNNTTATANANGQDGIKLLGFLDPVLRALAPVDNNPIVRALAPLLDGDDNDNDNDIGDGQDVYHQPPFFTLTGYDASSTHGPPLITVEALRAYLAAGILFNGKESRSLTLEGLGLGDDHCQAIAEHFALNNDNDDNEVAETSPRMLRNLWLRNNPNIGKEGYATLMGLLNRHHATLYTIRVDDKSWEAKFDFVMRMNTEFGRGQFLEDGIFAHRAKWVDWLEWLENMAPPKNREEETRNVNFLFYSLLENPGFLSS